VQSVKLGWAAAAVLALASSTAKAAPCGRPDLIETFPKDGSTEVPPNAQLSARYAPSAEYVQEEVTLEHVGVGPEMATVAFNSHEGLLTLSPAAPMIPTDSYRIRWPGLRGISTAVVGKSADVTFTVGPTPDTQAPKFAGVRSVEWDVERANDDCTGAAEERFVFDVKLFDATDDAETDMLSLVIFQTQGPGTVAGAPEPVLTQRFPEKGSTVQVRRAIDDAKGKVCFAALVEDSVGQISTSAEHEVCTKTVKPPFFYGCSMGERRGSSRSLLLPALLGALIFARIRAGRGARG
jgi:hypothetical protein